MEPAQTISQSAEIPTSFWAAISPYVTSSIGQTVIGSLITAIVLGAGNHFISYLTSRPSRHEKRLPEANVCLEYDRDEQSYILKTFDMALNDITNIANAVFIFMILTAIFSAIGLNPLSCGIITGFIVLFCLRRLISLAEDIKLIIFYRNKVPKA